MKRVEIDLPDETFAGLDREPAELATELRAATAAKWYEVGRVSQEVAAQIAGVSRGEFVSVLSRLQAPLAREYGGGVDGRATTAPSVSSTAAWEPFRDRTLRPLIAEKPDDLNLPNFLKQAEAILAWRATIAPEDRFWKAD